MSYFGKATLLLKDWIQSDSQRMADFKVISAGLNVDNYVAKYAYVQDVIPNLIKALMTLEAERVIAQIAAASR